MSAYLCAAVILMAFGREDWLIVLLVVGSLDLIGNILFGAFT